MNAFEDYAAFDALQKKLKTMWDAIGTSLEEREDQARTVVVVPSLSIEFEIKSSAQRGYEERLLFLLFLLRKPGIKLIYVTSQTVEPDVIDYYLELLPGIVAHSARKRLFLISPQDASSRPLSLKLLERPQVIRQIRSLIDDFDHAHMVPFNTTDLERELAVALGIPMYAADPRFYALGTKSGGRQIFAEEGVQHPLGFENLTSIDAIAEALLKMRQQRPNLRRVVVKLNEGVSGRGNALVDMTDLPAAGSGDVERDAIFDRLLNMRFELGGISYKAYSADIEQGGAIVEEFVTGVEVRSPSTQLRVTPLGKVEMLSTHDQMLGGPSGQSFLGAVFPADPAYSWAIMREAVKVGERFAQEGIVGRFAIDFVVVHNEAGDWDTYAIEINLRKGGTTAPFLLLQYLTDGHYDAEAGVFWTAQGHEKYYVASDHIASEAYRAFTVSDLLDVVSNYGLHYNHATQTGIIMHILSGVGELGRVGATAIENTPEAARDLYERFVAVLDSEAAALLSQSIESGFDRDRKVRN